MSNPHTSSEAGREGFAFDYRVAAPEWFRDALGSLPRFLPDADERMRVVNELAARNIAEGTGGPFAALVVDGSTGEVIAGGVNLVLSSGLASSHAEVVALSLAQTRLSSWDIGGRGVRAVLVVNAQPCVMCLGALIWSGIGAVEFAADGGDVERLTGFDEGPVPADWREQLQRRGIEVTTGTREDDALTVLAGFGDMVRHGRIALYNGGASGVAGA